MSEEILAKPDLPQWHWIDKLKEALLDMKSRK